MNSRTRIPARVAVFFLVVLGVKLRAAERVLVLEQQTRDPRTGAPTLAKKTIDPSKTAVIIIDPWNFHWCMTACQRVASMAPRWNRALECARKLGMQVMWAPTEVASMYAGTPQREWAAAVPLIEVPELRKLVANFTAPGGGSTCMCGPGISCEINYGADGIAPGLVIDSKDLIVSGRQETYSILKHKGLDYIIYMGLHTNVCLFGRPEALKSMYEAGLDCVLARDLNDAITLYDPRRPYTPDDGTAQTDSDLEKAGIPTINFVDEMRKIGLWKSDWVVDSVRLVPWGTVERPYFFEETTLVTLTCPLLKDAEIRYTLDGSAPSATSKIYEKPFHLRETTTLRTAAFRHGQKVSLEGRGFYARLGPVPPQPNVYLDQIESMKENYPYWYSSWHPVLNRSFEGKKLLMRGRTYQKGVGMRAPGNIRYGLKPEYDRFVARVGVDGNLRQAPPADYGLFVDTVPSKPREGGMGELFAQQPSIQFRLFIDGEMVAESPLMRFSQEPWRFDVKIPPGSRVLNLTVTDAGSRSVLNLADWADAGFVLRNAANPK